MSRILVAYVTHSGSTREIAEFIGQELRSLQHQVDVRPARGVTDLAPYDAVVAGGLLYRFGWHPEIVRFLDRNIEALAARPVALFVTGLRVIHSPFSEQGSPRVYIDPTMKTITPASSQTGLLASMATLERYLKAAMPAIERIKPRALACFAGKYDPDLLDAPNRTVMALVTSISGARPGDYRNWEAIRAWARGLELDYKVNRGYTAIACLHCEAGAQVRSSGHVSLLECPAASLVGRFGASRYVDKRFGIPSDSLRRPKGGKKTTSPRDRCTDAGRHIGNGLDLGQRFTRDPRTCWLSTVDGHARQWGVYHRGQHRLVSRRLRLDVQDYVRGWHRREPRGRRCGARPPAPASEGCG